MKIDSVAAAEAVYGKFFPHYVLLEAAKEEVPGSHRIAMMSLRPAKLKDVAERSDSIGDFGRHLRDWLHELRRASSRA